MDTAVTTDRRPGGILAGLRAAVMRDPWAWAGVALVAAIHLAVAGRYDAMRNELYFIVCGRHPDFGYADQPPLVPLLAAATQLFGDSVWLLRLPVVAASVALVPLTASFARLLGGGRGAAWLAGTSAAIAPALMAMATVLTTSSFEPLAWTGCALLLTRAVLRDDRRALLWAGVVAGVALQAKYGIALWLLGLLAGLAVAGPRRLFARPQLWQGAAIALLLAAPNLAWQAAQGWPFFEVTANHSAGNFTGPPLRFALGQALALNPLLAPLWLAGLVAPFVAVRLRPARFLPVAFAVSAMVIVAAQGKDYYLFPAYPTLFAVGAAALAGLRPWLRILWLVAAAANSVLVLPIALPVLSPPRLDAYLDRLPVRPAPDERAAVGAPLTQLFSDEFGWREMAKQVGAAYAALPAAERARTVILASNYGEAAALDVYGAGLPPALSGQNQYFLWGLRGQSGDQVLHVNGDPDRWRPLCGSVEVVGTFGAPYAMPYETGRPIFLCRGLRPDLAALWPRLKRYE
jgi:hypothetical protein